MSAHAEFGETESKLEVGPVPQVTIGLHVTGALGWKIYCAISEAIILRYYNFLGGRDAAYVILLVNTTIQLAVRVPTRYMFSSYIRVYVFVTIVVLAHVIPPFATKFTLFFYQGCKPWLSTLYLTHTPFTYFILLVKHTFICIFFQNNFAHISGMAIINRWVKLL